MYQIEGANEDHSPSLKSCSAYADFLSIANSQEEWVSRVWDIASENIEVIRHANGFLKIRLAKYEDGSCLRLHKWNQGYRGNPHNHKWDFIGFVPQGKLIEQRYFKSENFGCGVKRIFHYKGGLLVDTGMISEYEVYAVDLIATGAPYFRAAEEIHEVVAVEKNTLSIVATAPPLIDTDIVVLTDRNQEPKYEIKNVAIISSEACKSLI